jgi:Domain of unknown function (DUF4382)
MFKVFAQSSTLVLLSLGLAACGGGGGGSITSAPDTGTASFALSDAPVEGLSEVVITIDAMELRRKDGGECDDDPATGDCVFINDFTEEDGEVVDAITINLLDLQDGENQIIVQGLELEAGEYDQLRLSIIDEDISFSWVKETANGDELKLLKVPSDGLKLGGFTVERDGVQVFNIEFDLRKAMTYNPGPDRYILKPTGVRVVETEAAASISGNVGSELFTGNSTLPCVNKEGSPEGSTEGNVIYLYEGHNLVTENLADNFERTEDENVVPAPEAAIAPFTSQKVDADGSYGIYYLPAGPYTLAFSCEAANDDPEDWDGIVIPSPVTEIVELSLGVDGAELDVTCDLPLVGGACAPVAP